MFLAYDPRDVSIISSSITEKLCDFCMFSRHLIRLPYIDGNRVGVYGKVMYSRPPRS